MTRTPERLAQLLASVNAAVVGEHVADLCREASGIIGAMVTTGPDPDWFFDLRQANAIRQMEWDKDGTITLSYRGNELGGEAGEAQNVIKKLERERMGIRGSRATVDDLADELADVVICCDLIASAEGIDLGGAVERKFNATSDKYGLRTRLRRLGRSEAP